jgi:hypothetical protein
LDQQGSGTIIKESRFGVVVVAIIIIIVMDTRRKDLIVVGFQATFSVFQIILSSFFNNTFFDLLNPNCGKTFSKVSKSSRYDGRARMQEEDVQNL